MMRLSVHAIALFNYNIRFPIMVPAKCFVTGPTGVAKVLKIRLEKVKFSLCLIN
jgi:hypothetical protein